MPHIVDLLAMRKNRAASSPREVPGFLAGPCPDAKDCRDDARGPAIGLSALAGIVCFRVSGFDFRLSGFKMSLIGHRIRQRAAPIQREATNRYSVASAASADV